MSQRRRDPKGNIPTDLSEQLGSGLTFDDSTTSNITSELPAAWGGTTSSLSQTEPSVRPKDRRLQQPPLPPTRAATTTLSSMRSEGMSQRRRHPAGNTATDSSEQLGSGLTFDGSTPYNISSQLPSVWGGTTSSLVQTEPSVRPKDRRSQQPPPPPTRAATTTLSSMRSESMGGRSQSTGDLSDYSYGPSDYEYTLRRPIPDLWSSSASNANNPPMNRRMRSPPPIENRIPEPDIVYRYRNRDTEEPDPQLLRQPTQNMGSPPYLGRELANISRLNIREIRKAQHKKQRQKEYLESRGFQPIRTKEDDKTITRFKRGVSPKNYDRREMTPSRPQDFEKAFDPKFNKPLSLMRKKPEPDPLGPVGRQGFGQPSHRAMSLPDLSSVGLGAVPTNEQLFRQRFEKLKPKHQRYYENFRQQINWADNPDARERMTRVPTLMTIADQNRIRLEEISEQKRNSLLGLRNSTDVQNERTNRRAYIEDRSQLPWSIPDERGLWMASMYMQPIPENVEEDEEKSKEEKEPME